MSGENGCPQTERACLLLRDWDEMKAGVFEALKTVQKTHATVANTDAKVEAIAKDVSYLKNLEVIASSITKFTNQLLFALGTIAVFLCILVVFFVVKDSNKNLHFGGEKGLHIEETPR